METRIYLIRHGITPANKEDRFAGRSDEPLHPEGLSQIKQTALVLKDAGISRVYCGPLPRTRATAAIFQEHIHCPLAVKEGLIEINIPHWDGLTKQEITSRFGPEYPTWLASPQAFRVENCETIADVQQRAVSATEEMIAEARGEAIIAVSHLIVIRSLVLYYQGLDIKEFRSIKIGNGSLTELIRTEEGKTTIRLDVDPFGK